MQPISPDEIYATILNRGETRRTISVMFRGRLRQARQKVGVAVRAFFGVLECVVKRGEELEPSLDAGVVAPHFAYAFLVPCGQRIYGTWRPKGSHGGVWEPRRRCPPPNQEESNAFPSRAWLD